MSQDTYSFRNNFHQEGSMKPQILCKVEDKRFLPERAHDTDAGADLKSTISRELMPGEQYLFDTGVAVKIPVNYVGLVFNRSSQGKLGVTIPHSVGVIDSGFRSNIKVLLRNDGDNIYEVHAGIDRIAQLVIVPIALPEFVDAWNDTERGVGGFGSTNNR